MSMNQWLAQAYGTNDAGQGSDLEKTAQALMLNKLAEQEGIDLSSLDENQLALLAQEVSQQLAAQQGGGEMGDMGQPPGMPAAGGGMPMQPPMAAAAPPPMPQAAAPGAGPGPQAPQEGAGGMGGDAVKVAQAKMAEADFLGRMMAHALHQELGVIKQASAQQPQLTEEQEAEKTAMAYLAQRGYAITKQASAEGPLTRAIRSLGGKVD